MVHMYTQYFYTCILKLKFIIQQFIQNMPTSEIKGDVLNIRK